MHSMNTKPKLKTALLPTTRIEPDLKAYAVARANRERRSIGSLLCLLLEQARTADRQSQSTPAA